MLIYYILYYNISIIIMYIINITFFVSEKELKNKVLTYALQYVMTIIVALAYLGQKASKYDSVRISLLIVGRLCFCEMSLIQKSIFIKCV